MYEDEDVDVQGVFFSRPLYHLALKEISDQLTWDLVLKLFRRGPEEKKRPVDVDLNVKLDFFHWICSNVKLNLFQCEIGLVQM